MADKGRIVLLERRVAEHVVGMHVGVDHVADRLVGHGANRGSELAAGHRAAERVDDGDRIGSHHEARIGHVAAILGRLQLVAPLMHEHARGDLAHLNSLGRLRRHETQQGRCRERESCPQEVLPRDLARDAAQVVGCKFRH